MMKRLSIFAVLLLASTSLFAQQPAPPAVPRPPRAPMAPGDDPIANQLFPPELIMMHQDELNLQDKQRAAIREQIVKLQTEVVDLQWQLGEETQKMAALLRATPIDEAKTLEEADKVMSLERQVKRLHLGTLIRIKNALTPDQIKVLQGLRRPSAPTPPAE